MGDVVITYETLFELYRREKSRGDLQELDKNFYNDVIEYLDQKKSILSNDKQADNIFAENERIKAEKQLINIKKILMQLYELRVKKIVDMALIKARDPNFFIDDVNVLGEELGLYDGIIGLFNENREGLLFNVLNSKKPVYKERKKKVEKPVDKDLSLKIVKDTPEFCDADMNMLGPFEEGQEVKFPQNIADILLEKGFAEIVKN